MKSKCIFLILSVFLLMTHTVVFSQEKKKMTLKEREAAWRAERLKKRAQEERQILHNDSVEFAQAVNAIRNGSWALEASNITFNNGATRFVTASTNFISANNGQGIVQTAFDNSNIDSPNGLGGITLEGRITAGEIRRDNEGNIYYDYTIQGADISATVSVVVTAGSNQATATVSPNFNSRQITMNGYIYPYANSGIIEGTPGYY